MKEKEKKNTTVLETEEMEANNDAQKILLFFSLKMSKTANTFPKFHQTTSTSYVLFKSEDNEKMKEEWHKRVGGSRTEGGDIY